jgi:hypothetical protein
MAYTNYNWLRDNLQLCHNYITETHQRISIRYMHCILPQTESLNRWIITSKAITLHHIGHCSGLRFSTYAFFGILWISNRPVIFCFLCCHTVRLQDYFLLLVTHDFPPPIQVLPYHSLWDDVLHSFFINSHATYHQLHPCFIHNIKSLCLSSSFFSVFHPTWLLEEHIRYIMQKASPGNL